MLILLNTAKTFSATPAPDWIQPTPPVFEAEAYQIVDQLKALSLSELQKLMKISLAIAHVNHRRYAQWKQTPPSPALHAFAGEIYKKLNGSSLTLQDWTFAQKHLLIVSGLYGFLKPMDGIRPYRLEMYTKLRVGDQKDLYAFWRDKITAQLNHKLNESRSKALINLASVEYFSVLDAKKIQAPILNVNFKEKTPQGLKTVAIRAKWARGLMARYIIDHRITEPEKLKAFDQEGYRFMEKESSKGLYLFVQSK